MIASMMRTPHPPPDWATLFAEINPDPDLLLRAVRAGREADDYLSWDRLRRHTLPSGLTAKQWWFGVKFSRRQQYRALPLRDAHGEPFVYALPDAMLAGLDEVTRSTGGVVSAPELVVNPATRDRFLINSFMEESITSSQLEGAATSRLVAREMLRSGRAPHTLGERMILNNYRAMQFVREHATRELTPALICELHEIVTRGTLRDPSEAGRMQLPGEERVGVWSVADDELVHQPPPAEQLPTRMAELCRFANGESGERWLHPALRAIVTHFMVGYDHYFADGNGRTARLLFYWVALRNNLWLMEFVPISRLLKDAPAQYARSYLDTEQDDNDLTYFALHQLNVIRRAVGDFTEYLDRKTREVHEAKNLLPGLALNHRQVSILEGMLRGRTHRVTVRSHATSHGITLATARGDLRRLEADGLLVSTREGRTDTWRPVTTLAEALQDLSIPH